MLIPVLVGPDDHPNLIHVGAASNEDEARLLTTSEGYTPGTIIKEDLGEYGEVFIVQAPPNKTDDRG